MEYLSFQEAFSRKFTRQKKIKGLQYSALGSCAHIGTLSPGCLACFNALLAKYKRNFDCGKKCNKNCVYCPVDHTKPEEDFRQVKNRLLKDAAQKDYLPWVYSFSGGGEPLLHLDFINKMVKCIHRLCKDLPRKPWLYLYTNGILADKDMLLKLKDLGFDEIRFHLGASNFSQAVYNHIETAVPLFKEISVENPAWPPHRKQLFKMLPTINDIGVKHLNLGEIELTPANLKGVLYSVPNAKIYPCYEANLFDEGLVCDIIEEVIRKKYSFSVLDCNCLVKLVQRGNANWLCGRDMGTMVPA